MSRKNRDFSREVLPDAKYGEVIVTKFINCMMLDGKRNISEGVFHSALDAIKSRYDKEGLEVFNEALQNVRPLVEVRSRRVGGANYQVPTEVREKRQDTLAIRWLVQSARARSEKSMKERLANELYDASQGRGGAVRKKEESHKMAEANRAFAHYRW